MVERHAPGPLVAILTVAALLAGGSAGVQVARVGAPVRRPSRTGHAIEGIARRAPAGRRARPEGLRHPHVVRVGTRPQAPAAPPAAGISVRESGLPARLLAHPDHLALRPAFARWADAYGVPADLLEAMAWVESGWQPRKVSPTGAIGIGQLMPDTVAFMAKVVLRARLDPFAPEDNIRMTARFLRYLLDATGGRAELALTAYYQGLRALRERGPYPESRRYAATVLAIRPRFA